MNQAIRAASCILLLMTTCGCGSGAYDRWDKLGWAKRDILTDRVKDAREELEGARLEFKNTLERFQALASERGGDLEAMVRKFSRGCDNCDYRAAEVRKRIDSVDRIAQDLFEEWDKELKDNLDDELKRSSRQKLTDTRRQYGRMLAAMEIAQAKMGPVLHQFQAQLHFIKQNLNPPALATLQAQVTDLQGDVESLVGDVDKAIHQADEFIAHLK